MMNLRKNPSLVILTGAGISAESGIATFRDHNGLWENHKIKDVATPQAFLRDPILVYDFYNMRRRDAQKALPNAAHLALATLEQNWRGDFLLITQNVDSLHEQAGSQQLIHMHGKLNSALCISCCEHSPWDGDMDDYSTCPKCKNIGTLRPDIVWFGEMPYHMDEIEYALHRADYFVAIGTSGQVYPAAGFVAITRAAGAKCFELNLQCDNSVSSAFDENISGAATQTVPAFCERLMREQ